MKIATLAEIYFDRIIVQEVEDRLRREALEACADEQFSCMFDDMLRALAGSSVSRMSQARDSDVDTDLDSDLDLYGWQAGGVCSVWEYRRDMAWVIPLTCGLIGSPLKVD
jgi:hypothetical protein